MLAALQQTKQPHSYTNESNSLCELALSVTGLAFSYSLALSFSSVLVVAVVLRGTMYQEYNELFHALYTVYKALGASALSVTKRTR